MTAEEKQLKAAKEWMNEQQDKGCLIPEFNNHSIAKMLTAYLNSQRETIFKEELEKRLPSEEVMLNEIGSQYRQGDMMVGPIDSDEMSKMTAYLWLIQYLKK